jgi:hypothetical protein
MNTTKEDMRLLEEIRQTYLKFANNIPNWKTMNKNKLANLYLEHEHSEPERSYYFSALMCRYWSNVYKFYRTSKSTKLDISDFTSWLAESFFVAFKYRRWKDPSNKLYNDPQAPDKVINRCIYSTRMRYYQYYNMDKRKLNFQTDSIERQLESFGYRANVYKYMSTVDGSEEDARCKDIITYYLSKENFLLAIILDLICFGDIFREIRSAKTVEIEDDVEENIEKDEFSTNEDIENSVNIEEEEDLEIEENVKIKTTTKVVHQFELSLRKLLTSLRELDNDYIIYFLDRYETDMLSLKRTLDKIKDLDSRKKLSKVVNKLISSVAKDRRVKELLCL